MKITLLIGHEAKARVNLSLFSDDLRFKLSAFTLLGLESLLLRSFYTMLVTVSELYFTSQILVTSTAFEKT